MTVIGVLVMFAVLVMMPGVVVVVVVAAGQTRQCCRQIILTAIAHHSPILRSSIVPIGNVNRGQCFPANVRWFYHSGDV
jgi:hypothetical protein